MLEGWILAGLNLWILIGLVVALTGIALIICLSPVKRNGGSLFRRYFWVILAEIIIVSGIVSYTRTDSADKNKSMERTL